MEKPRMLSKLAHADSYVKVPLVELAGSGRVLIENHIGVLSYSQEEIAVRVCYGWLQVTGQNMKLAEMRREQMVITGQIDGIIVHRR